VLVACSCTEEVTNVAYVVLWRVGEHRVDGTLSFRLMTGRTDGSTMTATAQHLVIASMKSARCGFSAPLPRCSLPKQEERNHMT
jgi:hypothetical protein